MDYCKICQALPSNLSRTICFYCAETPRLKFGLIKTNRSFIIDFNRAKILPLKMNAEYQMHKTSLLKIRFNIFSLQFSFLILQFCMSEKLYFS